MPLIREYLHILSTCPKKHVTKLLRLLKLDRHLLYITPKDLIMSILVTLSAKLKFLSELIKLKIVQLSISLMKSSIRCKIVFILRQLKFFLEKFPN